jgi:soluble lytic murein transglycosylase
MEPRNLELLYPRAFREPIEALAGRIGLADPLLFALVREESHFDPGIVSRAGAVGLTQLMPATARDIAGRLKIQDPDLRDPELNLQLGGWHLGWLLERLQDVPKALMAYNAGLGRLRDWEKKLPDLPADLFVEAVPYEETRHYLRKILVSAVYYGYLYRSLSPAETVRAFYPHLSPQSLKAAEGGGR